MKKCSCCKRTDVKFGRDKSTNDGLTMYCKTCRRNRGRSKQNVIKTIYYSQRASSKRRGHNPPAYTKEELKNWLMAQSLFHKLYDEWVASGYERSLIPTVDRLDDFKGYSFDNIQILTLLANMKKPLTRKMLAGCTLEKGRVKQLDKYGNFIAEYRSIEEAHKQTKLDITEIVKSCGGKIKMAGEYRWRYSEQ